MSPFAFHYGPRLVSGEGAAARIGEWIAPGPVLFVTDAQVLGLGLGDAALEGLRAGGRMVAVFDAVEADPSRATLEAAVAAGREAGAASVIGFGGGSPMDVAKLAAYLLGSGDDLDAIWGVGKAVGEALPLVLVPTTAGTGSEATPVSIITLPGDEKRGVSSPALIAGHAVLDPLLTLDLPRGVTAATGMDAMVHAIEAYTSAYLKNPVSDMLAREALRLLAGNLPKACETPGDVAARSAMLPPSSCSGSGWAAECSSCTMRHAISEPLRTHFTSAGPVTRRASFGTKIPIVTLAEPLRGTNGSASDSIHPCWYASMCAGSRRKPPSFSAAAAI